MYEDLRYRLKGLNEHLEELGGYLDVEGKKQAIAALEEQMNQPGFWNDPETAKDCGRKVKQLRDVTTLFARLSSEAGDLAELMEMAAEESEAGHDGEFESEVEKIDTKLRDFEVQCTLSDPLDIQNCFLNIHPGAGGTESCDWADMLFRMYLRWAENRGFKTELIDRQPGEEAGIKNATIHVQGEYAHGFLKAETGIHRLVRISPFDSNSRRHTSFAAVHAMPEIEDDIDVDIKEEDLRVDTYRSSGAGGQHVNVTDSAVRITHIPTGIVVCCQNERSQHKNRATALKVLRSRIYDRRMQEQREKMEKIAGEKKGIAWGNQIRSYVFHPYSLIKDLRTGVERGDVQRVMDGDLDEFISSYLRYSLASKVKKE
ncbi:MAG TPA: peptide chain release factor 2 [bacterium]|nr:peptide chain release factor 2 [bacterium]